MTTTKIPVKGAYRGQGVNIIDIENKLRKDIHIYTLTLPTGAGKTLASLRVVQRLLEEIGSEGRRVIYVLPYVSIIEQNAYVWRKVLSGISPDEAVSCMAPVSEFHYNAFEVFDELGENMSSAKEFVRTVKQIFKNPVIFTSLERMWRMFLRTQRRDAMLSQFLHRSVVIFDEIQGLPAEYWSTFADMVRDYAKYLDMYFIFMTATQIPLFGTNDDDVVELADNWKGAKKVESFEDMLKVWEENGYLKRRGYRIIKRQVDKKEYKDKNTEDKLWGKLVAPCLEKVLEKKENMNIAIILNTIDRASKVFEKVAERYKETHDIYLLTSFIPSNVRKALIKTLSDRSSEGRPYIVVSTQVIEAGVDLDFDIIFREVAPLDAVIQSGGRCNRKGDRDKAKDSTVYVMWLEDEDGNILEDHMRVYGPTINRVARRVWKEIEEKIGKMSGENGEKGGSENETGGEGKEQDVKADWLKKECKEEGIEVSDIIVEKLLYEKLLKSYFPMLDRIVPKKVQWRMFLEGSTQSLAKESLIEDSVWSDVNDIVRELYKLCLGVRLPDANVSDDLKTLRILRKSLVTFFHAVLGDTNCSTGKIGQGLWLWIQRMHERGVSIDKIKQLLEKRVGVVFSKEDREEGRKILRWLWFSQKEVLYPDDRRLSASEWSRVYKAFFESREGGDT